VRFYCFIILFCLKSVYGQGVYTEFGQNSTFVYGETYSLKQGTYEIIYFKGGEISAQFVLTQIQSIFDETENKLNYNLSNGLKIVVFNNIIDYQKSNVNISNPQHYAGGYSQLNDNISYVYFEGNTYDFKIQIRRAVSEIIVSEFIFGGNIRERLQTSALLNLPDWYLKGVSAYLAESWNIQKDNFLKDFFLNKKQRYFNSLQKEDEVLAGHSIWRYIEERFGKSAVGNILFLTKISRSVETAFVYYTGLNMDALMRDWQLFYQEKYAKDEQIFKFPKGEENAPSKLAKKYHTQFKISPDGRKIAIVTNSLGKYEVSLYDIKSKKLSKIASGGLRLINRDLVNKYPLIAWQPKSDKLSLIVFKNSVSYLKTYNINGNFLKEEKLENIAFVNDFSYNNTGSQIVLSVLENAQTNLLLYNVERKTFEYILKDKFDKINPKFSIDGSKIYFVSNRLNGKISDYLALYQLDINSKKVNYLYGEQNRKVNIWAPSEIKENYISVLSDKNGIVNNYALNLKKNELLPLTNYKRSILYNDISSEIIADLIFFNNRFRIYINQFSDEIEDDKVEVIQNTEYRKTIDFNLPKLDVIESQSLIIKDSVAKNEIVKEIVKKIEPKVFISGFDFKDEINASSMSSSKANATFSSKFKTQMNINFLLQQSDNSILNNYLFPSNVDEKIFNFPLVSPLFQVSLNDPLKNHIVEAGVRIPLSIRATDVFFNYTNNTKRWDKRISIMRRSRNLDNSIEDRKVITGIGKISFIYPFSEVSRFEINTGMRNDRNILMPIDTSQLNIKSTESLYLTNGFEYVFDNISSKGLNLFRGIRMRIYNENYQKLNQFEWISNIGFDFRHYLKLDKQIYLATRLSSAFSFGSQSVAYYLGGVENWITPVDNDKVFNSNIPALTGSEYAFQTVVSPMRGFYRNTRGGNKFVLLNTELRVPIFAYLIQKPISSQFLNSVMLISFLDIGTAWRGSSPYSYDNPFNTINVRSNQYSISVNSQRDPFVYSFGFGARAKVLGHYVKLDHGWGLIESKIQKSLTTFSLGLDF